MISVRKMAKCLEISGNFSVVHHFFGYRIDFKGRRINLLQQIQLLQNRQISLNIIRVGSDNFAAADDQEISNAIQITRDIYATVNLGIGRIKHFFITVARANGRDVIADDAEAVSLTNEWTVPNSSFDLFIVLNGWPGSAKGLTTVGLSAVNGPCEKNKSGSMTGSVVTLSMPPADTGQNLAHELGHYLGLSHVCDLASGGGCGSGTCQPKHNVSLMNPCLPNGGSLSNDEGKTMNKHCFVKDGCPGN